MINPIRIIFLDMDGVMNSRMSMNEINKTGIKKHRDIPHPTHINALNKIIKATNAKIVISSSWRVHWKYYHIEKLLYSCGCICDVIDETPYLNQERGLEILAWLNDYSTLPKNINYNEYIRYTNGRVWYGDVESFVILDDDDDMGILRNRLIKTKFETGLQDEDADKAIDILLNKKWIK